MDELLIKEEIMWKQRSCLDKMKWRDRNTKKIIGRPLGELRRTISATRRSDGCLTNDLEELKVSQTRFSNICILVTLMLILLLLLDCETARQ